MRALGRFGIESETGRAPRAFCNGRFNVLIGNRKVAGASQRVASRGTHGAVLLHASVLVDADPVSLTAIVARFYELAGVAKRFDAAAVTSLAECLPSPFTGNLGNAFIAALANELTK